MAGAGDRPVPSWYLASFAVFGRAAIGGGDDPASEANGAAHPEWIPCANCAARIAIVVSISCSTAVIVRLPWGACLRIKYSATKASAPTIRYRKGVRPSKV